MKCRKCGHIVNDRESKCRYCGARIIRSPLASARRAKNKEFDESDFVPASKKADSERFERDNFSWDTHDFPGERKPTKNMEFDWATFDAFHTEKKTETPSPSVHHEGDEVALLSREEVKAAKEASQELQEMPESTEPEVQEQEPTEIAETAVEQEPSEVAEGLPDEVAEPEEACDEEPVTEIAEVSQESVEEDPSVVIEEPEAEASEPEAPCEAPAYEETTVSRNPLEELMQLEKDTEEKKASEVEEFYTFHKKNAEFQELLDREYEKYRSGRISPATERMEDAMEDARGEEDDLFSSEEKEPERIPEELSAVAEPEAAVIEETEKEPEPLAMPEERAEEDPEPSKEESTEEKESETEAKEAASDEVSEATPTESEEDGSLEAACEGEKTPEKRKIRGWIVALIVIALVVALMAGIVALAPNSGLGKLLGVAQTEQNAPVPENQDRSVAAKDKTGLIQREIDRDKDCVLGDVYYDKDLKYEVSDSAQTTNSANTASSTKSKNSVGTTNGTKKDAVSATSEEQALAESKVLKDNSILGKRNGDDEYLDEAIVGAVIEKMAADANSEKPSLAIGEIRKNGKDYFVWVEDNGSRKICTVRIKGESPKVVKVRTLK